MNQICDLTKTDLVSHESWQIRTQIHMSTCLHNDFNYTPATPGWIKWLIYTKRGWTQQFPIKTMFGINDCEPARIKPLQASIHPRLRAKFVPAKKCVHHAPMCHLSAGTQCYPDTDTLVRQHSVFNKFRPKFQRLIFWNAGMETKKPTAYLMAKSLWVANAFPRANNIFMR